MQCDSRGIRDIEAVQRPTRIEAAQLLDALLRQLAQAAPFCTQNKGDPLIAGDQLRGHGFKLVFGVSIKSEAPDAQLVEAAESLRQVWYG